MKNIINKNIKLLNIYITLKIKGYNYFKKMIIIKILLIK